MTFYPDQKCMLLHDTIELSGEENPTLQDLEALSRLFDQVKIASVPLCMVNIWTPNEARDARFARIEALLQKEEPNAHFKWRRASPSAYPADRKVIESETERWSSMMHSLGAKGRREWHASHEGKYSAYYVCSHTAAQAAA